jgi:hypothetical protein
MLVRLAGYLIVDKWRKDESGSVIVLIKRVISLIINDHVVQDNASTHDQHKSALRVRSIEDG